MKPLITSKSTLNNIPKNIESLRDINWFAEDSHPLTITKDILINLFSKRSLLFSKNAIHDETHIVSTFDNFDRLLFECNHSARRISDSYYYTEQKLLRTHMTCREHVYISSGLDSFLVYGKVFRRDEIDSSHFPVFHQLEGVSLFDVDTFSREVVSKEESQPEYSQEVTSAVVGHLRETLGGVIGDLFGNSAIRWPKTHFPFTFPSFEAEVQYQGKWLEVLGAGVLMKKVLDQCYVEPHNKIGWAFGIGLERIAMILFDIPDIRWFWSQDERFLSQFRAGTITKFRPFSCYPPLLRDLSFYLPEDSVIHDNDVFDVIRQSGGDVVESVKLV
jgi:phenylalanyl-tRNA synthetase alpha chain